MPEFDWDDGNLSHIEPHRVAPQECEQVLFNDPVDAGVDWIDNEERYRSTGIADTGRLLTVVWTTRRGRIRVITAFDSGKADRKLFLKRSI